MAEPNAITADQFLKNLQERCDGLFYLSESEYPLEPVLLPLPKGGVISDKDIVTLTGLPESQLVETVDLPYFFRNHTAETPDGDDFTQSIVQRFRDLQTYMEKNLTDIKVYRIGKREIQVYALGKLNENQLAGFKTISVET